MTVIAFINCIMNRVAAASRDLSRNVTFVQLTPDARRRQRVLCAAPCELPARGGDATCQIILSLCISLR